MQPQTMALNSRFFDDVRKGSKTSTIRKGKRSVRVGERLALTDNRRNRVEVDVTQVDIKRLVDLTDDDAQRDGFESTNDLADALREFYPLIRPHDVLTVVGFVVADDSAQKR